MYEHEAAVLKIRYTKKKARDLLEGTTSGENVTNVSYLYLYTKCYYIFVRSGASFEYTYVDTKPHRRNQSQVSDF